MTCCSPFQTNEEVLTREPNPVIRPLNHCGDKGEYKALDGAEYKFGMPVKLSATSGVVEPALDGVGAIGLSTATFVAEDGDKLDVHRTGHVYWSVVATAIGKDVASEEHWWAIHQELIKANIYVEFK